MPNRLSYKTRVGSCVPLALTAFNTDSGRQLQFRSFAAEVMNMRIINQTNNDRIMLLDVIEQNGLAWVSTEFNSTQAMRYTLTVRPKHSAS